MNGLDHLAAACSDGNQAGLARLADVVPRAGLTDPRALSDRLDVAERQLEAAHAQLADMQRLQDAESERVDSLIAGATVVQRLAEATRKYAERLRFECDRLAYGLVRVGAGSVIGDCLPYQSLPASQGVFTRRRPYLAGDCVWEDDDRDSLFVAMAHLQPGGRRPSKSRSWRPLDQGEQTTIIETAWYAQAPPWAHPAVNGWAVRQTDVWVDSHWCAWGLEELSREHLLNVIEFLYRHCASMYARELQEARAWMPCPVHAYEDCVMWLLDTPLHSALVAERARRRVRRGPHRYDDLTLAGQAA